MYVRAGAFVATRHVRPGHRLVPVDDIRVCSDPRETRVRQVHASTVAVHIVRHESQSSAQVRHTVVHRELRAFRENRGEDLPQLRQEGRSRQVVHEAGEHHVRCYRHSQPRTPQDATRGHKNG